MVRLKKNCHCLSNYLLIKILLCSNVIFLFTFNVNVEVTVFSFFQREFKLGFEKMTCSKSTGLLNNSLLLILGGLKLELRWSTKNYTVFITKA